MSDRWTVEGLVQPISAEDPCGKNLEDTGALGLFDAYQIFGQASLAEDPGVEKRKDARKSDRPPNWREIEGLALETLTRTQDLRVLVHLATACLWTDGLVPFVDSLTVASRWLDGSWHHVHPRVDEDSYTRQNALNCFADPVAVIDRLRRAPLVNSRQHGSIGLRDIDIAEGMLAPGKGDTPADKARISAAFASTPLDALRALRDMTAHAVTAAGQIDAVMRREAGTDAAPSFEQLNAQLLRIGAVLNTQIAGHPDAPPAEAPAAVAGEPGAIGGQAMTAVGDIRSRQDAIRALDAAAEFFRRNEPSSPVPLLVDRAKRLVSKDFLEVLADLAPDALAQARAAGGLKNE